LRVMAFVAFRYAVAATVAQANFHDGCFFGAYSENGVKWAGSGGEAFFASLALVWGDDGFRHAIWLLSKGKGG